MERVRAYLLEHPEITAGRFSWFDRFIFHGTVNGRQESIAMRIYSDDISIDTDDRAALIDWTYNYHGFDVFFTDPDKVRREYTSPDGHRITVTYYRDEDTSGDIVDDDIYLSADPDDPASEFTSYEDFRAAVVAELEAEGYQYEYEPRP